MTDVADELILLASRLRDIPVDLSRIAFMVTAAEWDALEVWCDSFTPEDERIRGCRQIKVLGIEVRKYG